MSHSPGRAGRAIRRERVAAAQKPITTFCTVLVALGPVLGMAAGVAGALEVYPYECALAVSISVTLGMISLALLIGAVCGLYIMGGAKVAPFGVVFVAGFGGLVLGLSGGGPLYRDVGVLLLAVSGAVFYSVGFVSGHAPANAVDRWGHPGAIVGGALLAAVGHLLDLWPMLLFGAMAAGCGLGTVVTRWRSRSAPRPPDADPRSTREPNV
ncbi:hypothetical protein J4H86_12715 [Spiractinospora alimapuensis]|uniref:hypothetical protein n=1 Tax=Spiractinospora alimapuensis TaxID=2820884 RepID=UPI001F3B476B|nr:hypothetical protein [Spiractinospora alimapuensis]QVQ54450.1 hypothetical protein J4H86_12715 [Spiractinospora alimapuensis]